MNSNSDKKTILLIDDEEDIREMLSIMISRFDYQAITAEDYSSAIKQLNSTHIHMCLTDMNLPDGSGLDVIDHITKNMPDIPVAVFTAHGNVDLAVNCLQKGAFDFISKPVMSSELKRVLDQGVNLSNVSEFAPSSDNQLLGDSTAMQTIRATIRKIARSQAPVYISGPSGSGKELAARQIHQKSTRQNSPFIAINCGAIPAELMESEFFGHTKGSFTGAIADKKGLFESANTGTLFLDEVADLPLNMQVKLLRAIQEKKIRPIGSNTEKEIDVRILSATHKDLKTLVQQEKFREDLFFRINVIPLSMPSLAERPEDILLLAKHIINNLNEQNSQTSANDHVLSDAALQELTRYSFPGNVRELENILERACALSESNTINAEDLMLEHEHNPEDKLTSTTVNIGINDLSTEQSIDHLLQQTEQEAIIDALKKTSGNKTQAAKLLGISFRSLRYKLTKFDTNQ